MPPPRKRGALKGARKVKRLLKRLPDDVNAEMAAVLRDHGPAITAYAKAAVPNKKSTGKLAQAINWKVLPKSLSLRVGLLTKATSRRLFYARILEFGRKGQTVVAKRRTKTGRVSAYRLRVKPINRGRYDFLAGRAMTFATANIRPALGKVWERALTKAASGGGDE
jgi:hypothetical protein